MWDSLDPIVITGITLTALVISALTRYPHTHHTLVALASQRYHLNPKEVLIKLLLWATIEASIDEQTRQFITQIIIITTGISMSLTALNITAQLHYRIYRIHQTLIEPASTLSQTIVIHAGLVVLVTAHITTHTYRRSLTRSRPRKYTEQQRKHYLLARFRKNRSKPPLKLTALLLITAAIMSPVTRATAILPPRHKPNKRPFSRKKQSQSTVHEQCTGHRTHMGIRIMLYVVMIIITLPQTGAMHQPHLGDHTVEEKQVTGEVTAAMTAAAAVTIAAAKAAYTQTTHYMAQHPQCSEHESHQTTNSKRPHHNKKNINDDATGSKATPPPPAKSQPPPKAAPPPLIQLDPQSDYIGHQVLNVTTTLHQNKRDDKKGSTSKEFRSFQKNIAGADLRQNNRINDTLLNAYDAHIDVLSLLHLSDKGEAMTETAAAEIQRLVQQWRPPEAKENHRQYYQAIVAIDSTRDETNPDKNDTKAASVCVIIRSDATIRNVSTHPGGRLIHIELMANNHKSVHIIAAYPRPGPYTHEDWEENGRHRILTEHIVNLFKHCPQGTNGYRQGPTILCTDANSCWFPIERGRTTLHSSSDGKYSLAANLKKIGAVTCFMERFKNTIIKHGLPPVYTWQTEEAHALLDHTVLQSKKAYRKYFKAICIDNADNIMSGSDHRGVITILNFEALFSTNKNKYYSNSTTRSPRIGLPPITPATAKSINQEIDKKQPRKKDLIKTIDLINNLNNENHKDDKIASAKCGQIWDIIVQIYHKAYHETEPKKDPNKTTRSTTSMAADKERNATRAAKQYMTALTGTQASMDTLCANPNTTRERQTEKLTFLHRLYKTLKTKCTDYETQLPPSPPNHTANTSDIAHWVRRSIPIMHELRIECVTRMQQRTQRNAQKFFQKQTEQWRAGKKGYMNHMRPHLDPPDFSVEEDPKKEEEEKKEQSPDEQMESKEDGHHQTFSTDEERVLHNAAQVGWKHCQHSKCPDGLEACIHTRNISPDDDTIPHLPSMLDALNDERSCECMHIPAPPQQSEKDPFPFTPCNPRSEGKCKQPWTKIFKDDRGRRGIRVVGDDEIPDNKGAQYAHRLAKPLPLDGEDGLNTDKTIPSNWADSVMADWTMEELEALLKKSSTKGSKAGLSGVSARFLTHAPPYIKEALLKMFQTMQDFKVIPHDLARGVMTPLRKTAGKPRLADCRPITLLEDPMKIFTRGLSDRIMGALSSFQETRGRPLLSSLQTGFVFNSDCLTALWPLLHTLEDANRSGKELHVISVDIRRAYDSVESTSNELASRRLRMPEGYIQLMRAFDDQATTATRTPFGLTQSYPIERGVRQGDSLSPLRFVLWLDSVMCEWERQSNPHTFANKTTSIKAQGYVDDTFLFGSTLEQAQERLDALASFLADHGLQINTEKTMHIWLNTKNDTPPPRLHIRGGDNKTKTYRMDKVTQLGPNETFKYLGVYFTASLNFEKQWKRLTGGLHLMLNRILSQELTPAMIADTINIQVIPCITWATQVALPTEDKLNEWDNIISKRVNKYLAIHNPSNTENDPISLPKKMGGLSIFSIKETLLKIQLRNLKTALNSTHPMLRETTRHAWNVKGPQAIQHPPMLHRLRATLKSHLDVEIRYNDPTQRDAAIDELIEIIRQPTHHHAHTQDQHSTIFGKQIHTPTHTHTPTNLYTTFTSDGSIHGKSCGCATVKVKGQRWGGKLVPLLHSKTAGVEPTPYADPITGENITTESRRTKLTSPTIKEWPSALPEAWPIAETLMTTPFHHHKLIHTDCQVNISNFIKLVLKTPSDVAWDGVTDRWLWEYIIRPLYKKHTLAGGSLRLNKIRSHAHEKGKIQHEALNALSDTADTEANLARDPQRTHRTIDIDPIRKACAAEYEVYDTKNDTPLRIPTTAFSRERFAEKRLARIEKGSYFRAKSLAYLKDQHACSDASKAPLDFKTFQSKIPVSLGYESHIAKFIWQLRMGPLQTLKIILRNNKKIHQWIRTLRTLNTTPPNRPPPISPLNLCSANQTNKECECKHQHPNQSPPTHDMTTNKPIGTDMTCFCNMQEIADHKHVLLRCPFTRNNYIKMLLSTAEYMQSIGRPHSFDRNYTDPSSKAMKSSEINRHMRLNPRVTTETKGGIASIILPAPSPTSRHTLMHPIHIRADIFLGLIKRFSHTETIHDICYKSAMRNPKIASPNAKNKSLTSPTHIPHEILQWFRDNMRIRTYHIPLHGQEIDFSPIARTAMDHDVSPTQGHKHRYSDNAESPHELGKQFGLINLINVDTTDAQRYIRFAGKAASAKERPTRLIIAISGRQQHQHLLHKLRSQHGAKLMTIPPGRFPQVTQFDWIHKGHTGTRDQHTCIDEQVSFIIFQNNAARKTAPIYDIKSAIPELRKILTNNLRGGATGLRFRYSARTASEHSTYEMSPAQNPNVPTATLKKLLRPLHNIQNWLILPRPELHHLLQKPVLITDKSKQAMEIKLQNNTVKASQLLITGLAPAHLKSFISSYTKATDPALEARALTTHIMNQFNKVWRPYNDAIEPRALIEANALPPGTPFRTKAQRPLSSLTTLALRANTTHQLMTLPCEGTICQRRGNKPRATAKCHLCPQTAKLKCKSCLVGERNANLLRRFTALLLTDPTILDKSNYPNWPTQYPTILSFAKSHPSNTNPRTIASFATIPENIIQLFTGPSPIEQIPVGGISLIMWVAFLRHHNQIHQIISRLWETTHPLLRPRDHIMQKFLSTTVCNIIPSRYLAITSSPHDKYLSNEPNTKLRCEGPLCRYKPVITKTKKARELKWRAFPKHFIECNHCANHTANVFSLVKFNAARNITEKWIQLMKETNAPPNEIAPRLPHLPTALRHYLDQTHQDATREKVAGNKRPQIFASLGNESGYCAILWALHLHNHDTIDKEHTRMAKLTNINLTPGRTNTEWPPLELQKQKKTKGNKKKEKRQVTHITHTAYQIIPPIRVQIPTHMHTITTLITGELTTIYMNKQTPSVKATFPNSPQIILTLENAIPLILHKQPNHALTTRKLLEAIVTNPATLNPPNLPPLASSLGNIEIRTIIQLALPPSLTDYAPVQWPPANDPHVYNVIKIAPPPRADLFYLQPISPDDQPTWQRLPKTDQNVTWRIILPTASMQTQLRKTVAATRQLRPNIPKQTPEDRNRYHAPAFQQRLPRRPVPVPLHLPQPHTPTILCAQAPPHQTPNTTNKRPHDPGGSASDGPQ